LATANLKVVRKNPEKIEEIRSLSQRAKGWAEAHPVPVVGTVVGIFVVLALAWGINSYMHGKDARANADYAKVFRQWSAEKASDPQEWEKLIPELEKFIKEHEGGIPARNAQVDLAQAYFQTKRYEDALKLDNKVLAELPAGNDLRILTRYQLASTYQALGKADEAMAQWTTLKQEPISGMVREVNWHLARLYFAKGDFAKAVEQYEEALKTEGMYPGAPILQEEMATAKLKAGIPDASPKADAPKEAPKG